MRGEDLVKKNKALQGTQRYRGENPGMQSASGTQMINGGVAERQSQTGNACVPGTVCRHGMPRCGDRTLGHKLRRLSSKIIIIPLMTT